MNLEMYFLLFIVKKYNLVERDVSSMCKVTEVIYSQRNVPVLHCVSDNNLQW